MLGYNGYSQLGRGAAAGTAISGVPTAVVGYVGFTPVTPRSYAGTYHTCTIIRFSVGSASGDVRCWGRNEKGELGTGDTVALTQPLSSSVLSNVKLVGAGLEFTCALEITGGVKCWGDNMFGQLGTGVGSPSRNTPPSEAVLSDVVDLTVGASYVCAVQSNMDLRCWGYNTDGQLGTGTTSHLFVPSGVVLQGVTQVSCGLDTTCAVTTGGVLKCWAPMITGNWATGPRPTVTGPVFPAQVAVGRYHTCATPSVECKQRLCAVLGWRHVWPAGHRQHDGSCAGLGCRAEQHQAVGGWCLVDMRGGCCWRCEMLGRQ